MDAHAIRDAVVAVRDALAGAGVVATIDPSTLVAPGAWVMPREIPEDAWTLTGPSTVSAYVYLIAGDVGVPEALDVLSELLAKTLTVLTPDGPVNTSTAVSLPDNPTTALPAFLVPVSLDL